MEGQNQNTPNGMKAAVPNAVNSLNQKEDLDEEIDTTIGEKSNLNAASPADLPYEYKYAQARKIMTQNPNYRWVLYHILRKCNDGEPHKLEDLEAFVTGEPGYTRLKQPPYFPIHWLDEAYALEEQYLDEEGNVHTWDELKDGTEDEFDDLVVGYAYVTTEVGQGILEEFSPSENVKALLVDSTARQEIYQDILRFTQKEPQGFAQLERRIRSSEAFAKVLDENPKIKPDVFVDKLSTLGGIAYDGGWKTTMEGEEILRTLEIGTN